MPLAYMKDLLEEAEKKEKAVGAFNVANMEMLIGAVKAAESSNTPIIIQIAEMRLKHSPFHLIAPMMVSAAKHSSVNIAVHFDHGRTETAIRAALDYGFTSVMFDGSSLPLEENMEKTAQFVRLAKTYGAGLEAELGTIGGSEGESTQQEIITTDPKIVPRFIEHSHADALAVAIGNAHGHYKGKPRLSFPILKEIQALSSVPLVLHGGSGISDEDFQACIRGGIRKINIATASFDSLTKNAKEYLKDSDTPNYFELNEAMVAGVYETVLHHINVFNNKS
ncbi:ketose-bisphosphate aldolase [Treponema phagedenis]|uniref:ketose-bisphosphate aldolase n=2 Tax=Treponema phagedenis TaxID=162 RepID=UPI0004672D75|nr:ketose-bisphosphate aldolase [Treponema phagedenis]